MDLLFWSLFRSSMNHRTRVKICGITATVAAECAIDAGADALGLVFYESSPRNLSIESAAEIAAIAHPFVSLVGLFVDTEEAEIQQILDQIPLQVLQFHGSESPEFCGSFGLPYIKALRVKEGTDISAIASSYSGAQAILLDAYKENVPGGTGESFNWDLVPELDQHVILAGGLNSENIGHAISKVNPYAVDTSGGVESAPGVKDPARIRAFISQVIQADFNLNARS